MVPGRIDDGWRDALAQPKSRGSPFSDLGHGIALLEAIVESTEQERRAEAALYAVRPALLELANHVSVTAPVFWPSSRADDHRKVLPESS